MERDDKLKLCDKLDFIQGSYCCKDGKSCEERGLTGVLTEDGVRYLCGRVYLGVVYKKYKP